VGLLAILFIGMATTFRSDNNKYFEITKNIEIFTNLYKELNTYYVDELDPGKLMRTGIDAMVESLDPFTNFYSESEIESYRFITEGRYNGIGAMSKKIGDYVTITELYEDQPADQAGLKPGDQIIAVDGKDAKGKDPDELNEFLRGFPGTEVKLTVRRIGEPKDLELTLVRGEVSVPNVPYYGMVSEDVGYVALTTFTRDAGRNVGNALKELQKENPGMKGVIFDLRGNGGGLLSEAVNVSNVFIPKGELVATTKGKVKDWDRSFSTMNAPVDEEIPLIVLIDKNSASASEIVSGVIQDYDRGVLMGQRSYGKGLVQNTRDVGYNARVKLTTAKYYIPSGRCIQSVKYENGEPVHIPDGERTPFKTRSGRTVLDGGGVKPDVEVAQSTDLPVVKGLLQQDLIFDFVTQYTQDIDSIPPVEEYSFQGFDQFMKFLESRDFSYDSDSERLLDRLTATASTEEYDFTTEITEMEAKIKASKRDAVRANKAAIIDLIEKEIASRYYYQTGKVKMRLKNDQEIEDAIQLLRDGTKYNSLLEG
jgi:carboxyl-terminal processing protease